MKRCHLLVLVVLIGGSGCSDSDSSTPDGSDAGPGGSGDAGGGPMLGTWSTCELTRRLEFTTPADTADRVVMAEGSIAVTDNGDGTITVTPSAADFCDLDFTVAATETFANIVTGQTCTDGMLTLAFADNGTVDVSTGELAASFVVSFDGLYEDQPATGVGGTVFHCTR